MKDQPMNTITTKDGTQIYYKDWGAGQPVVFSHGWPLSADDWDAQMLFFLKHGYRVIAYDRPGAKPSQGVIWNWWRQGMMGGAKAHYEGIVAFSQTDFTEDLKKITVPVLVMHGDDDQIVPYADSAPLSAKLLKNSTLKTY